MTPYELPADMEARTPAPEGEVLAWRWVPTIKGRKEPWMTGDATPWVYHTGAQKPDFPHCRSGDIQDLQPLYASPVVPVGVSREAIARIIDGIQLTIGDHGPRIRHGERLRATNAILAALRPTDTGSVA